MDRIIAMDQGVVAEIGSYEELMNHDGAFAKFMKTYLNEQHSDDSDSDNEGKWDIAAKIYFYSKLNSK